ncbi:MAG TPA: lipoprotein signal peptidase [Candidatus Prevotella avicola]|jgi:signal peptidase II|uniref:Lipoprotein signal peptidase n=1 Tax=Candidatus Prevotella avicola TaxID=2838738 RepID=A0A9D2FXC8_9BACT|nr:lipoprotein signal peptidase [Candidatus Prevotella avicola]
MKASRHLNGWLVAAFMLLLLLIDQVIKIYVKTHFCLGESVRVTDWFFIEFIENNGMAWGISFFNKLTLSVCRLVAIVFLLIYIRILLRNQRRPAYILLVSLIIVGAIGNMIDSTFYGLIFSASSPYYTAYFVPFGTGYESVLMGKVVDMFYFPFFTTTWPSWLPLIGGNEFTFFSPVFNFADVCVCTGTLSILVLMRKEFELSLTEDLNIGKGNKKK